MKHFSDIPHCEELLKKLHRANGMLSKVRYYVHLNELKNIYYAIFSSIVLYGAQICSQSLVTISNKVFLLQKKQLGL